MSASMCSEHVIGRTPVSSKTPTCTMQHARAKKERLVIKPLRRIGRIPRRSSIPVVFRLVRSFERHAEILRLLFGELGELRTDLVEMQPRHFLVEVLGESIHADRVGVLVLPKIELRE